MFSFLGLRKDSKTSSSEAGGCFVIIGNSQGSTTSGGEFLPLDLQSVVTQFLVQMSLQTQSRAPVPERVSSGVANLFAWTSTQPLETSGETVEEQRLKLQLLNIAQPATNVFVIPCKTEYEP
ncbi:UBAP1-MVB12-associated (UMA)-domain containing protein 1 isoform X2 [Syngnathoides biaculeatus]|uniref:UBAP1-MVB12-associated (UMA)-domain containing protein 1 isoform X2 n=1 Tax=Syngnathoides biaculeatus TaxID=300417 RepID=UPI002ADD443C|nr:UBAP1-MVB12-associated (UMA)-domain containing protein 1 isoform X2 [Syngnathoides biaculeatus]